MQIITAEEIKARLDAGETIHLVDVREPHEHAEFNIGGMLVPLGKVQSMQTEELEDMKNEEVICYCRSGARSMQACMILEQMGFTNMKNLAGGMLGWKQLFG
jgi:rhodanese-related sulfurtransferase